MLALTCGHCSRDHQEGVKSFFEKRKPEFTAELQNNHPMYPWWYEANVGIEPKGTKGPSRLEKKKKKKSIGVFLLLDKDKSRNVLPPVSCGR